MYTDFPVSPRKEKNSESKWPKCNLKISELFSKSPKQKEELEHQLPCLNTFFYYTARVQTKLKPRATCFEMGSI